MLFTLNLFLIFYYPQNTNFSRDWNKNLSLMTQTYARTANMWRTETFSLIRVIQSSCGNAWRLYMSVLWIPRLSHHIYHFNPATSMML